MVRLTHSLISQRVRMTIKYNVENNLFNALKSTGEYKVYKRRWIILGLFTLYSAANAMHWIQYSIIANIIQR